MSKTFSPEWIATVEKIRAFLATVPIAISNRGVSYLDFDAYRAGKRRTPEKRPPTVRDTERA